MAVSVLIHDVEYRATTEFSITQQAGATSSTKIDVLIEANPIPVSLQDAQILIDTVPVFWGIIQTVETPVFNTGYEVKRYTLTIQSGEVIFQNRLISESYTDSYTHEIVSDLFTNYIEEEGITLGQISTTDRFFTSYVASFLKASDVFTELADEIGASCYISPDKKFYFILQGDFVQSAIPEPIGALKGSEKAQDIRSIQIITGAVEKTTEQTRVVVWETNQLEQAVSYPLSEAPFASINSVSAGVGLSGVDNEDTSKSFLWTYGSPIIKVNTAASTKPVATDTVAFLYKGMFDILVTQVNDQLVSDISTLSGTSGKIEKIYTDETIDNIVDADTMATNMLSQYGERESELSLICFDVEASQVNNLWNFERTAEGITGAYVIVERTITQYYDGQYKCDIKMKNRNFFSRYGTVFNKIKKQQNINTIVYKNTSLADIMVSSDTYSFDNAGIPIWPSVDGFEPAGFPQYPMDFDAVSPLPYTEGQVLADGSVVVYVSDGGYHGVIVAPDGWYGTEDDPTSAWSNILDQSVTTSSAEYASFSNTLAIIAQEGHAVSAAKLCNDHVDGSIVVGSVWALPSLSSLNSIYDNKSTLVGLGTKSYWTSTQKTSTTAYYLTFTGSAPLNTTKDTELYIRPVRRF